MTTQYITPEKATDFGCPMVWGNHESADGMCIAQNCIFWRWQPLMTSEPGYKEALTKAQAMHKDERGGKLPAIYVNENRAKFGLKVEPYKGWCGMAGEPKL